ncbi:MAG: spore coat protein CotJB [Oscillospiraceae bacterium]
MSDRISPCGSEPMLRVSRAGFALSDAALYLDTHPQDAAALAYYQKMRAIHDAAVADYTAQIGPLSANDVLTDNEWAWIKNPWPWQTEG